MQITELTRDLAHHEQADLEAAIHAGSTMVRVGTAIFGRRATGGTP